MGRRCLSEISLIFALRARKLLDFGDQVLCFAGFELDTERARLRGPGGDIIRLRPKSFDMLQLFVTNAGRILSKQDLIDAIWPNIHVGDDSLFQCVREIRTALGDDQRQLIKLVSGRGYLFESNRHTRYAVRTVQTLVQRCAHAAGITRRVHPHLLRHSIATILLDSGQVPIDQVRKFLGHLHLSTTQIYAETSLRALGENYVRALGGQS